MNCRHEVWVSFPMQLKASRIADNCDSVICHAHDSKETFANNHRSEAKAKS